MYCRRTSSKLAFTLIEIMVVIAIIGIIAGIAIPSYMKSKEEAKLTACIENIRTIQLAVETFQIRHHVKELGLPNVVDIDEDCILYTEGYLKSIPRCPSSGKGYRIFNIWSRHDHDTDYGISEQEFAHIDSLDWAPAYYTHLGRIINENKQANDTGEPYD